MASLTTLETYAGQVFWLCASGVLLFTCLCLSIHRLFLSPISHIPGPKLAAMTQWYETYYDFIRKGQYTLRIAEMHQQYGPMVRISPREVHCNDPTFIDQIYAGSGSGKKRDRSAFWCLGLQLYDSIINTTSHDLHRLRRSSLNRFFSKSSATKLEPMLRDQVELLCAGIHRYIGTSQPCNLTQAFGCLTTDIITTYCFGFSDHYLSNENFVPNPTQTMIAQQRQVIPNKHFPWLLPILRALPDRFLMRINPIMNGIMPLQRRIEEMVTEVMSKAKQEKPTTSVSMFSEILNNPNLAPEEKTWTMLREEALLMIAAGTETASFAMSVAMFHLLSQPETREKLLEELRRAIPDSAQIPSWAALEKLHYLSATISETLRLSYGVSSRMPRVPHEALYYRGEFQGQAIAYKIPAGTDIGMTNYLVHHTESIFPDSHRFSPERWLDMNGARRRDLDPYLLSFSKGSRQCLGVNLAYAELFVTLATVLIRFGEKMELYETTEAEVKYTYDLFGPGRDSYVGVRVIVK